MRQLSKEIDWIEGVPGGVKGDGGTGCIEGDSGLGISATETI